MSGGGNGYDIELVDACESGSTILQRRLMLLKNSFGVPDSIVARVDNAVKNLRVIDADMDAVRQDLLPAPTIDATTVGAAAAEVVDRVTRCRK